MSHVVGNYSFQTPTNQQGLLSHMWSTAKDFVTSAFVPFDLSTGKPSEGYLEKFQETFQQTGQWIKQEGMTANMRRIFRAIKEHPLDAITLFGSSVGTDRHYLVSVACATTQAFRNSQLLINLANSIKSDKTWEQGVKFALCGAAVYAISAIPAAAAATHQWDSYADAKKHYPHPVCLSLNTEDALAPLRCLGEGNDFSKCAQLVPTTEGFSHDLYVFTRALSSNAISIVQPNSDGTQACFYTTLDTGSSTTKTCFPNLNDLSKHTVEILDNMPFTRIQEGLEAGHSIRHIAIHHKAPDAQPLGCATFYTSPLPSKLDKDEVCLLTVLPGDNQVSQTCFNLAEPTAVQFNLRSDIMLHIPEGQPGSMIIRNLQSFSTPPELGKDAVCMLTPLEEGISQACFDPNNPAAVQFKVRSDISLYPQEGQPGSIMIKNPTSSSSISPQSSSTSTTCSCECPSTTPLSSEHRKLEESFEIV